MKIVVDANIILSALIKDSVTRRILKYPFFEFCIPDHLLEEIEEHIDEIAEKSGLSAEEIRTLMAILFRSIEIVPTEEFKHKINEATKLIADIDDVPYVALALFLGNEAVIWSHDKAFERQKTVKIVSTADLLELLK